MTAPRRWSLMCTCGLVVVAAGWSASPRSIEGSPTPPRTPRLTNACVVTHNVKQLVEFYEPILEIKATISGETYAGFPTGAGVLAIFSAEAQEEYIPGSTEAAKNKSVILEFRVADVDEEYRRLQSLVKIWVKPPTTQPWGTRSIYFRDPDGNLVNFFTPVQAR
jgi:uncharacterized glyoxalase superfamily protein PhnB